MNISKVTECLKVADVVKNLKDTQPLVVFDYVEYRTREELKSKIGRVYLLTSDKIIKKIGYSRAAGGIRGTLSAYQGGMGGRPSLRTHGIHVLLYKEVESGHEVEVYAIWSDPVDAKVKGLFGNYKQKINASYEMEERCMADYKKVEGGYPDWNLQEQGKGSRMPGYIFDSYTELIAKSMDK